MMRTTLSSLEYVGREIIAAMSGAPERSGGGEITVEVARQLTARPLPIAGSRFRSSAGGSSRQIRRLNAATAQLGCGFLRVHVALVPRPLAIPALKLTDQGLVDAVKMEATALIET